MPATRRRCKAGGLANPQVEATQHSVRPGVLRHPAEEAAFHENSQ